MTVENSPFAARIARHCDVDTEDLEKLETLTSRQVDFIASNDILERGDEMKSLLFLVSGWAIRCRYTEEGSRQIVHVLLPGDIVTPNVFVANYADHGISAVSDCVVRFVEPAEMQRVFSESRSLAAAFWWAAEQENGMLREQIVRLGRRPAFERIPHLFLELHRRLHLVGLAAAGSFELPLTQNDIADVLGLSSVHVNRTLRKLVALGHIGYQGGRLQMLDKDALALLCDFDLSHLHLDQTVSTKNSRKIAS